MIDQKEFERWINSPEGIHTECEIRRWHGTNVVTSNQLWDWYTKIYLPIKQKEEREKASALQSTDKTFLQPKPISEKNNRTCHCSRMEH
ncbi:MAG: hypothetical protein IKQ99_00815 [Alphaproteobacteria bacterium]|nr:hypothetical protein [Alphaproteobacteria bacterium]